MSIDESSYYGMNIDTTDSIKAKAQILGIVTVNASPQYVIYTTSVSFFFSWSPRRMCKSN